MKLVLASITLMFLFSFCAKETRVQRDLDIDISLKSEHTEITEAIEIKPTFYPNPFVNYLWLNMGTDTEFELNISNSDGFKKKTLNGKNFTLDFGTEKPGCYNAEVLVNGTVYRTLLIKL